MTIDNKNIFEELQEIPEIKQPKLVHSSYFVNIEIIRAIATHLANMRAIHIAEGQRSR